MLKYSVFLAALALVSLPAQAQRLPTPSRAQPTSVDEVLSAPIPAPIRNTPMGRQPLMIPGEPNLVQPAGIAELEECQTKLFQAASMVDGWQSGEQKSDALGELKGARVAILASDPRTCTAHVQRIMSGM